MTYWIFKCNPAQYRIDDRLANPAVRTTWRVTRYRKEIRPGDVAFIWRADPRQRGICAVMAIDSYPRMMTEIPEEESFYVIPKLNTRWRVEGQFTHRGPFVPHTELRVTPGLDELSVFHGVQRGTNFRVTDAEGKILMSLMV